jgi:8-oxo-dGTP diphosphatase
LKDVSMPKTTVVAIITASEGPEIRIVLVRRGSEPFKGEWCLPGGHIDLYEPAREAIIREVKEETNLEFDGHFLRYFDEIIPERDIHAVVIVFEGPGTGSLMAQPGEVTEIGWFSLDEARALPLAFRHSDILEEIAHEIATKDQTK